MIEAANPFQLLHPLRDGRLSSVHPVTKAFFLELDEKAVLLAVQTRVGVYFYRIAINPFSVTPVCSVGEESPGGAAVVDFAVDREARGAVVNAGGRVWTFSLDRKQL